MAALQALVDRFPAARLVGQFLLSRDETVAGWQHERMAGWRLSVEPTLPCQPVLHRGECVGWLLGHAIDATGRFLEAEVTLDSIEIERSVEALGGRFALLLPGLGRVYLDSCGLLSVVYCEAQKLVASTASLISYDGTPDRDELVAAMGLPSRNAMFPVDMTPRHGVDRLLPNHYLDLESWTAVRHWPNGPLEPVDDVPAAVSEIADTCAQQLRAPARQGGAALRLTGGRDSRMLLACARDHLAHIECVTADLRDDESRVDCNLAGRVSRRAGVSHRVLPWRAPDEDDLSLWLFRAGLGTGEQRGWRACTLYRRALDPELADVLGVVGELGRGMWWRPDDDVDTPVSVDRLLGHAKAPDRPETRDRVGAWKAGVEGLDSLQMLDLFYLEQRLGCWAGVVAYAEASFAREQIFPMAHRRIVELMMRMPSEYRRSGRLPEDVIALKWPDLLSLPFNEPSAWHAFEMRTRRLGRRVGRLLNDPVGVARRRLRR